MKKLVGLLLLLSGCATTSTVEVVVTHDDERRVTCYIFTSWGVQSAVGGIDCIPDSQLQPTP